MNLPYNYDYLRNKNVLITGASRGIGACMAEVFYAHGARVIMVSRDKEALEHMARKTHSGAGEYVICVTDLSSREERKRLIEIHPEVDILVNNSGITRDQLSIRMSDQDWDEVLELNLKAAFDLCKSYARPMMKNNYGRMINITSVVATCGNIGQANYVASKAAMVGVTKTMALELAKKNVTVNAIAPGFIKTDMTAKLSDSVKDSFIQRIPMQRFGSVEEVAFPVLFLTHPMASYVTGQTLHVNGGMVMP